MPTPRKKKSTPSKVKTVDSDFNKLELYCIWLNEYYCALRSAGFNYDIALAIMMDKESYPDWVEFKLPNNDQISKYMDEDED